MLEEERFQAIKKLARDIREDNKVFFNNLENEELESAIKQKEDFISKIISNMASAFSSGEKGKEERQIFRANILIPDDEEFYKSYSKDKNIRNLMNKYAVNIEDIMSKITELNIYGKYINNMNKEEDEFVDEMVNISKEEADEILDEIEGLSDVVAEIELENVENEKSEIEEPGETENSEEENIEIEKPEETKEEKSNKKDKPKKEVKEYSEEDTDEFLGDSFENIEGAISGFVTDFNNLQKDLKKQQEENENLKRKVQSLTDEKNSIVEKLDSSKEENEKLNSEVEELKNKNADLTKEIDKKNKRMKLLEEKLYKSATLLKKVYNGINK